MGEREAHAKTVPLNPFMAARTTGRILVSYRCSVGAGERWRASVGASQFVHSQSQRGTDSPKRNSYSSRGEVVALAMAPRRRKVG